MSLGFFSWSALVGGRVNIFENKKKKHVEYYFDKGEGVIGQRVAGWVGGVGWGKGLIRMGGRRVSFRTAPVADEKAAGGGGGGGGGRGQGVVVVRGWLLLLGFLHRTP